MHSFDHNGETVPFSWQPNATSGTWTGEVTVQALEIGGDVNARITTDFSFPLTAAPVYTAPVPMGGEVPEEEPEEPEEPTEPEPVTYGT